MSPPLPSQYDIPTMSHPQYKAATISAPVSYVDYVKDTMNAKDLAAQTAGDKIDTFTWLESSRMVDKVKGLKDLCIGNCRLLYGSERFKFYDIVISHDETYKQYCAVLTCNQDNQTKFLRTVSGPDPIVAVRELVARLQKDTAKLFYKYSVGSQLEGQQGYTNPMTGQFELWDTAVDKKIQGPQDDTAGLIKSWSNAPGGVPRATRGYKRRAEEQMIRPKAEEEMNRPKAEGQTNRPQAEEQINHLKAEGQMDIPKVEERMELLQIEETALNYG